MSRTKERKQHEALTIEMEPEPATYEMLQTLLHALVRHCLDYMERVPAEKRSAAHLGVIRQLIKDNGVALDTAHKVDPRRALQALAKLTLPFKTTPH